MKYSWIITTTTLFITTIISTTFATNFVGIEKENNDDDSNRIDVSTIFVIMRNKEKRE